MTQQELEKLGYRVKYRHRRPVREVRKLDGTQLIFQPKEGWTDCFITNSNREVVASGWSKCAAIDNFNRKLGNKIAFGRAVKQLKI